jgi:hypothetical protein
MSIAPRNSCPEDGWNDWRRYGLLLALGLAALYWRVLFGGESFFFRDFGVLAYPTEFYFKHSILNGEIPFWNPYSNCGAPFLAQWGTMVLYPFHYLLLLLPLPWGVNFFCLAHLWWAGMGMRKLAKALTGQGWPAAVAGWFFVFNGITLSALTWPNYTVAIAWMPWLVYFALASFRGETGKAVPAILSAAMQMLSGAPEIIAFAWLLVLGLAAREAAANKTSAKTILAKTVCFGAATLVLCAAQLLPFVELALASQRQLGVAAAKWSLPAWGWLDSLFPMFHAFKTPQGAFFQEGQEFIASTYTGSALFLAACFAIRLKGLRLMFACLGIFGMLLALGPNGGVFQLLQMRVPGASMIRYPVKAVYLASFVFAALSAFFVSDLAEKNESERKSLWKKMAILVAALLLGALWAARAFPFPYDRWNDTWQISVTRALFAFAILGSLLCAAGPRKARLQWALLGLVLCDAGSHLPNLNPTISNTFLEAGLWKTAHALPQPGLGTGRLFITPQAEERLLNSAIPDQKKDWMGKRLACWSHLNLLELAPKVNGSSTLQLREESIVERMLYSTNSAAREPWLDFLNATHISSPESYASWTNRVAALPFVRSASPEYMSAQSLLELLPQLDVRSKLYLLPESKPKDQGVETSVEIESFEAFPGKITVRGHGSEPGWVSISQSWEKNWVAYVNGARREVARANLAFQAVRVPQGAFTIELKYEPRLFWAGLGVSLAALLALCLPAIRKWQADSVYNWCRGRVQVATVPMDLKS